MNTVFQLQQQQQQQKEKSTPIFEEKNTLQTITKNMRKKSKRVAYSIRLTK